MDLIDVGVILLCWMILLCFGIGLLGEFIITPWREWKRQQAKNKKRPTD